MEQWCDVPGWVGFYQVSNWGRVRSLDRLTNNGSSKGKLCRGRILVSKNLDKRQAYQVVTFSKEQKYFRQKVHRLVAQVFIPNPEGKPHVGHIDNNPKNNHVLNLEWCDHAENMRWMAVLGRSNAPKGDAHSNAKFTSQQVRKIKKLLAQKSMTQRAIAKQFQVHETAISSIKLGKTWKHV